MRVCIIGCCDRLNLTSSGSLEKDEYESFLLGIYILDSESRNGKSMYKHRTGPNSIITPIFTFNDRRKEWVVSKNSIMVDGKYLNR